MDDARRFNMDPESLANLSEALRATETTDDDDDGGGVWPENWPIVQAFLAVATQWRVVSIGGGFSPAMPMTVGLDYSAVRIGLEAEGIDITPELWRGLRVMESAAAAALNEVSP